MNEPKVHKVTDNILSLMTDCVVEQHIMDSNVMILAKNQEVNISSQTLEETSAIASNEDGQDHEPHVEEQNEIISEKKKLKHCECPACKIACKRKLILQARLASQLLECFVCKKKFKNKHLLKRHVKLCPKDKYKCHICGIKYIYERNLVKHYLVHQKEKPDVHGETHPVTKTKCEIICSYCDKKFKYKLSYKNHMFTHSGNLPYECLYCKVRFSSKEDLFCHGSTHDVKKVFDCEQCDKVFTTKHALECHVVCHSTGDKLYEVCGENSDTKNTVHSSECEDVCPCHVCKNEPYPREEVPVGKLTAKSKKNSQLSATTGNNNRLKNCQKGEKYVCTICGKSYNEKAFFEVHKCHYECKKCQKVFQTKDDLDTHLLFLGGERLVSCDACKRIFHGKKELGRHLISYVYERKHRLLLYAFTQSEKNSAVRPVKKEPTVKIHMVTHTGKNSLKCSVCKKDVSVRYDLQDHMKVEEDKSLEVPNSGEEYVYISRFNRSVVNRRKMASSFCECHHNTRDTLPSAEDDQSRCFSPSDWNIEILGKHSKSLLATTAKLDLEVVNDTTKFDAEAACEVDSIKMETSDAEDIIKEEWDSSCE